MTRRAGLRRVAGWGVNRGAAVGAATLLFLGAWCAPAPAAPDARHKPGPTVLTFRLAVDAAAFERFALTPNERTRADSEPHSTFTLGTPRSRTAMGAARVVLAATPGSAAKHDAMAAGLTATGLFSEDSAARLAKHLSSVAIEITDARVRFRGRFASRYPWHISSDPHCQVHFRAVPVPRASLQTGIELHARVVFTGARPASATPLPESLSARTIEWNFAAKSPGSHVCTTPVPALVLLAPRPRAVLSRVRDIVQTLLLAIPTTVFLLLGLRWALPRTVRSPKLQQARRLANVILVLPLALVFARGLQSIWLAFDLSTRLDVERLADTMATALAAAAIVIGTSYCARCVRRETRAAARADGEEPVARRRGAPRFLGKPPIARGATKDLGGSMPSRSVSRPLRSSFSLLLVTVAIAVTTLLPVTALAVPHDRAAPSDLLTSDLLSNVWIKGGLLLCGTLVAAGIAALLITTAWRGLLLAIPSPTAARIDRSLGPRWRRGAAAALVMLIVVLSARRTVDVLQFIHGETHASGGLLDALRGGEIMDQGRYFDVLSRWPSEFIVNMAQAATYLLPLIVVVAVGHGLLADSATNGQPSLVLERPAARAIAVTFAGGVIVAGTSSVNLLPARIDARAVGSTLDRFFVPVGLFAIGVIAIGLIVRWRGRAMTVASPTTEAERGRRLRNTALAEVQRRRQQKAYDDFLADKTPPERYFTEGEMSPVAEDVGLSNGPHPDWRSNARDSLRYGAKLAILPVGYVAYVAAADVPRSLSAAPLTPAYLIANIFAEGLFWLILAFTFGALYAYLPRRHGMFKGAALGALVLLSHAAIALVLPGREASASWLFVVAEATVFGMVLGVLLDLTTLGQHHMYWRHLLDIYRVRTLRVAVAYGVPFGVAIATIISELVSGNASNAAAELAKTASMLR